VQTPGCIAGDIVDAIGLAQSTVSEHLRILRAAGVIAGEVDGPRVCYTLNPNTITALSDFIITVCATDSSEHRVPASALKETR